MLAAACMDHEKHLFFLQLARWPTVGRSERQVAIGAVPGEGRGEGAEDPGAARTPAPRPLPDRRQPRLSQGPHTAGLPHHQGRSTPSPARTLSHIHSYTPAHSLSSPMKELPCQYSVLRNSLLYFIVAWCSGYSLGISKGIFNWPPFSPLSFTTRQQITPHYSVMPLQHSDMPKLCSVKSPPVSSPPRGCAKPTSTQHCLCSVANTPLLFIFSLSH